MLASELISLLADAISKQGDKPVVVYYDRADELSEIDGVSIDTDTNYMSESMNIVQSTVFQILY